MHFKKTKKYLNISFLNSKLCYFLGSKFHLKAFDFFLYLCIYLSTMSQRRISEKEINTTVVTVLKSL